MLRRSFFAQTRHLESNILIYKPAACISVICSGRRLSFTRHTLPGVLPTNSLVLPRKRVECIIECSEQPQIYPAEFEIVIHALKSNLAQERILQFIKDSKPLFISFSDRKKLREIVESLAQTPMPQHSLQVLNLAYKLGCTLNASAYESVCFHLAKSSSWDIMLGVIAAAANHLGRTTLRLLNWRALALLESHKFSHLRRMLEEFKDVGIVPTRRTYHIILSGCMRNYDMEGAKACLQDMKSAGFPMDATTHSLIGNLYRIYGADSHVRQNALDSLSELQPETRITVINRLIQSSLDVNDLSNTARLLVLFDAESIFNIVSVVMSHSTSDPNSSISLDLPKLPGAFLKPNSNTCAIFMNYLIRKTAFNGAITLGKKMNSTGIVASSNLVASFIHAYFLNGQGNTAIRIALSLSVPSAFKAFQSLMIGFDEGEEPPPLDLSRICLSIRICNVLLRGIVNRQGLGSVPNIFSIMHSNNLRPNARTLEILLSYMNKSNIPRPRTFFQVLRKLSSAQIIPSLKHMHHVIARIFRDEKDMFIPGARTPRLKKSTRQKRIRLLHAGDPFDPTAGITFDRHLSYRAFARPLLKSFRARGVMSDSVMMFLRIRQHSVLHMDVESAHRVLRTLMARGMRPNEYHIGALVEGYALSGNFSGAIEVIKTAERFGIKPNAMMYTSLISAHSRRRDVQSAMQTFKDMVALGIAPDVASIDALVSSFHTAGAHETARELLMTLWNYIQPFPAVLNKADLPTMLTHFRALNPVPTRLKSTVERRKSVYGQVKAILKAYNRYFASPSRKIF